MPLVVTAYGEWGDEARKFLGSLTTGMVMQTTSEKVETANHLHQIKLFADAVERTGHFVARR